MELKVYNINGSETGRTINLDDSVFAMTPNDHAIYLDCKQYLANQRQGTHKSKERSDTENAMLAKGLMDIFRDFGGMLCQSPESEIVKNKVSELQNYITEHYYKCTDDILKGLGEMYAAGGDFTENIDKAAGEGTAVFVNEAIKEYLK